MKKASVKKQAPAEVLTAPPIVSESHGESLAFDPIALLIAPLTESSFIEKFWEKEPLFLKATAERREFAGGLFDMEVLCEEALEREEDEEDEEDEDEEEEEEEEDSGPLLFGHDLTSRKYVDDKVVLASEEFATEVTLRTLFNQGYTFQVHQPQRFSDDLWLLVSALEQRLQCLAGTNCYITPPSSQGLAPHHDDVELFILQTQGSKTWRVYRPSFHLPSRPSMDLDPSDIGEPIMEVTLNVGDMLYLPRGFIHQAVSSKDGSAHLTISSFQGWTFGGLASASLSTASDIQEEEGEEGALPLSLRSSLPWGFLGKVGLLSELSQGPQGGKNPKDPGQMERQAIASRLAGGLRDLADSIESNPSGLLSASADDFLYEFAKHRICPHPDLLTEAGHPPSSLDDFIMGRGEGLFALVPIEGPEDEDVPEGFVKIVTPLMNSRAFHMLPNPNDLEDEDEDDEEDEECEEDHVHGPDCHHGEEAEEEEGDQDEEDDDDDDEDESGLEGPVVPAAYAPLISMILSTCQAPGLQLRTLVTLAPHKDEEEVLRLAYSLWDDGFISTLPPQADTVAPQAKKIAKKQTAAATKVNSKEPAATVGQSVAEGKKIKGKATAPVDEGKKGKTAAIASKKRPMDEKVEEKKSAASASKRTKK